MEKYEIIQNIAKRTGGDIYLGIVGAVRTGKSTFIKKVVETLIVPNIEDEYERKRAFKLIIIIQQMMKTPHQCLKNQGSMMKYLLLKQQN